MSDLFPDEANRLRDWLLSRQPRRQATLFLVSTTVFFCVGAALGLALQFELLTPAADRFSAETYAVLFTLHGELLAYLFLLPALFGVLGNLAARPILPWLGLLGWYLHLGGGAVLLWALAAADRDAVGIGRALALAGVLAVVCNVVVSAVKQGKRWAGPIRGGGAAERAFVRMGVAAAVVGATVAGALIVWRGWGPLQGTYFEVGSRHLLLSGLGLGVYLGRLHWRRSVEGRRSAMAAFIIATGIGLLAVPQFVLAGLQAPRRYIEYEAGLQAWQVVSAMGGLLTVTGCVLAFWRLFRRGRSTGSP